MRASSWMVIACSAALTTAACNVIIGADEPIVVDESSTSSSGDNDADAGKNDAGGMAICGDGIVQAGEECDDGNLENHDGCEQCQAACLETEIRNPQTSHCYLIVPMSSSTSWDNAEADCVVRDGHLVSITSKDELLFFQDRFQDSTWIGGRGDGMSFVWSSGEPWWSGAPWPAGQPTPATGQCVAIRSQLTVDMPTVFEVQDCNTALSYVCERALDGTMP